MLVDVHGREEGDWTVVAVVGELDLASAPRLRQAVVSALAAAPASPPLVVLDLEAVPFVDSSGLGLLLGVLRRVRQAGGTLRLVAGPPVTELLALLDLDSVFTVVSTLDAALAPVGSPGAVGDGAGRG